MDISSDLVQRHACVKKAAAASILQAMKVFVVASMACTIRIATIQVHSAWPGRASTHRLQLAFYSLCDSRVRCDHSEGTNALPIQAQIFGKALCNQHFHAGICKQADGMCIPLQVPSSKALPVMDRHAINQADHARKSEQD